MFRYILISIIVGIVGSIIAIKKGYNPTWWFILCAIFPLLIVVIAVLPARVSAGYTKKCRYCLEIIKENAIICKHCGREQPIDAT